MKKFKKIDKWFGVQLSNYVLCGEVYTPHGPKVFYTGTLWGLKDDYAICFNGFDREGKHKLSIFKLGNVDKTWIKSKEADVIDNFELND